MNNTTNHTSTLQPEKLNLWDRFFNRYRKIIVEEGDATWYNRYLGVQVGDPFTRRYVIYKTIDRLTGSERLDREYLTV